MEIFHKEVEATPSNIEHTSVLCVFTYINTKQEIMIMAAVFLMSKVSFFILNNNE